MNQSIAYKAKNDSHIYEIRNWTKGADGELIMNLLDKAPVIIRKIMEVREAGEYLFTHKDGSCIKGACFTEKLKRIYNYVRITKHSLYMIRKTYAIILRENGLDDAFIYLIFIP